MMPFEHHTRPLLPRNQFYLRVLRFGAFSFLLIGFSLGIGMLGYHSFSHLSWLDSLLNASMILTGMGPVDPMLSDSAKLFASVYAIYSGVAFLSIVAVFLAPIVHRFLHRLHLDEDEAK
jgi:hypothetical protein